jgi:uncharacterized membrane protein
MLTTGIGHFVLTDELLAQVPAWMPLRTAIVIVTGFVEVALAVALVLWRDRRRQVGWALAAYLVVVFVGNISQAIEGTSLLALDSDVERWGRLFLQPVLVAWALWCTGAWPRGDEGAPGSPPMDSSRSV